MELNLIRVGFLGVCFGLGGKLKTSYESTHTYVVSENIPVSTWTPLILLITTFFCKNQHLFCKNSSFTHNDCM